jgi:hypothetical protein
MNSHVHLGRTARVRMRAQPAADHLLGYEGIWVMA